MSWNRCNRKQGDAEPPLDRPILVRIDPECLDKQESPYAIAYGGMHTRTHFNQGVITHWAELPPMPTE